MRIDGWGCGVLNIVVTALEFTVHLCHYTLAIVGNLQHCTEANATGTKESSDIASL